MDSFSLRIQDWQPIYATLSGLMLAYACPVGQP